MKITYLFLTLIFNLDERFNLGIKRCSPLRELSNTLGLQLFVKSLFKKKLGEKSFYFKKIGSLLPLEKKVLIEIKERDKK